MDDYEISIRRGEDIILRKVDFTSTWGEHIEVFIQMLRGMGYMIDAGAEDVAVEAIWNLIHKDEL